MGMWSFIVGTVDFATQYGWRLAYAFAAMTALEIAFPAAGRGGWLDRARSLSFWMAYVALTAIGMTLFLRAWSILGWRPLFSLRFVGAPIIGLMLTDFFYYWFHRLQHRSAWLWRFHAVHHSIANMSAVNSPHHFTEELFRIPFVVVPVALLFQVDTWFPVAVMTVIGMHGYYIHSSTRLHFGRLGWIVNDARMHCGCTIPLPPSIATAISHP